MSSIEDFKFGENNMLNKQNITIEPSKNKPLWTRQESINFECAKEVIMAMIGVCFDKECLEKLKDKPDLKRLAAIEEEENRLHEERRALRWDDHAEIVRIRREYGAAVRAYNEKKRMIRLNEIS